MESAPASVLPAWPFALLYRHCKPLQNAGGFSGARFWLLEDPDRPPLCLRQWPPGHPDPARLAWIHQVLQRVGSQTPLPLPVPYATRSGDTCVRRGDYAWELGPWLCGTPDNGVSTSATRIVAAMQALAQFHEGAADVGREVADGPAPCVAERCRFLELHGRELPRYRAQLNRLPEPLQAPAGTVLDAHARDARPLARALERAAALTFDRIPCIRDIRREHVLFTEDRVTGIVDFGSMRMDAPITDIARLLGSFAGDGLAVWQSGLAAYDSHNPPAEPPPIDLLRTLDRANLLLGGLNWLRWFLVERRTFEDLDAVERRLHAIADRLSTVFPWD